MKKEIKERWIEALESGRYEQGAGYLHEGESFCCLGVLCDIVKEEIGLKIRVETQENGVELYYYDGEEAGLPESVIEYTGVDAIGKIPRATFGSLATMNDSGSSFTEIARVIRQNF
jgi:hypothetical protein